MGLGFLKKGREGRRWEGKHRCPPETQNRRGGAGGEGERLRNELRLEGCFSIMLLPFFVWKSNMERLRGQQRDLIANMCERNRQRARPKNASRLLADFASLGSSLHTL